MGKQSYIAIVLVIVASLYFSFGYPVTGFVLIFLSLLVLLA